MASKTTTTTTTRTIAEIKGDLSLAYLYGVQSQIVDNQAELIATLGVILAENFPSDTPLLHLQRVALHVGHICDDARKF